VIVVDTGPVVAAAIKNDRKHDICVGAFTQFRSERRDLLVPAFVAGEISYMLGKIGGAKVEAGFRGRSDLECSIWSISRTMTLTAWQDW
jgi:uncharacterized protein